MNNRSEMLTCLSISDANGSSAHFQYLFIYTMDTILFSSSKLFTLIYKILNLLSPKYIERGSAALSSMI